MKEKRLEKVVEYDVPIWGWIIYAFYIGMATALTLNHYEPAQWRDTMGLLSVILLATLMILVLGRKVYWREIK